MSNNTVNFTINLNGNAYDGFLNLDRAIGDVIGSSKEVTSSLSRIGMAAFNFDVISNVVGKVSQAFQSAVGSSLEFEQQQANIKTLLNGDAEATSKLVSQIKDYSKATTYDTSGLVDAQKTMMAFGLDAEYAFGKLKNIGDIALGDQQHMQQLTLAFSQMSSTGKLMGQDFNQMVNAGFNPLEVISQKTGKSIGELREEMGKGAISAEMVAQAFEWATEEGGRFHDGAAAASETTAGKIARMNKTIDDLKIKLFEATGGATAWVAELGKMAKPLSDIAPLFRGLGSVIKKFAVSSSISFAAFAASAKAACKAVGTAIKNIPIIGWIAAAVSAVVAAVTILWNKSEGFRRLVMGTWEAIKAVLSNVWTVIKNVFGIIWNNILKPYFTMWKTVFVGLFNGIKTAIASIVEFFSGLWEWLSETVSKCITFISTKLGAVGTWIKTKLVDPIKNAFTGLWNIIRGVFDKIISKLGDLFAPIRELWNKIFPKDQMKDVSAAYARGAEKGTISWENDQKPKANVSILGEESNINGKEEGEEEEEEEKKKTVNPLNSGKLGSDSGVSAGKAQQITIKLENMVGTMNFNGGLRENARDVESILVEQMARILGMATTAM